jgi:hypothetical protein
MVVTFEKLDIKWSPTWYYLGRAVSDEGKEFTQCLVDREQFPKFIETAEKYFKKELTA